MTLRPRDTSAEAWAVMEAGLRAMKPEERVRRALALTAFTHQVALAGIRERYPDETPRQHKLRLAARYIDAETMRAAFGFPSETDD